MRTIERARTLVVAVAATLLGVAAPWLAPPLGAAGDLDRTLVDALSREDAAAARRALERGADPNAVLGERLEDHALCSAIDSRGAGLLGLLLEFGARVDEVATEGRRALRTPLACAIHYYNPDAFDRLLALGADPDADLCPECGPGFGHTPLTEALTASKWPMALELARRGALDEIERRALVVLLERRPYDAYHPWADEREALIRWTRAQGVPLDARPASEGPPGTVPTCMFSVRDMEEGLSEGTICP